MAESWAFYGQDVFNTLVDSAFWFGNKDAHCTVFTHLDMTLSTTVSIHPLK